MRKFIQEDGFFEITIPAHWEYELLDDTMHTFQDPEMPHDDMFFISIGEFENEEKKNKFAELISGLPQVTMGEYDCRTYPDETDDEDIRTKPWTAIFGSYTIYFGISFANAPQDNIDQDDIDGKVDLVKRIISSFHIWPEDERERRITSFRFEMFLQGLGAANAILKRAIDNNAFIEGTCLISNLIDCLLRLSIVLKLQIDDANDTIGREWIYQGLDDKKKSEKDIYKKALALAIIPKDLYDDLFELYEDRNRVIHRFIISEITLTEVEEIMHDYLEIMKECAAIMDGLESEQVRLGVGITVTDEHNKGNKSPYVNFITGKIGNLDYLMDK
jgi:hypothetical protein